MGSGEQTLEKIIPRQSPKIPLCSIILPMIWEKRGIEKPFSIKYTYTYKWMWNSVFSPWGLSVPINIIIFHSSRRSSSSLFPLLFFFNDMFYFTVCSLLFPHGIPRCVWPCHIESPDFLLPVNVEVYGVLVYWWYSQHISYHKYIPVHKSWSLFHM